MTKIYSVLEVTKHTSAKDCWVIHDSKVYDVTGFAADHPGGEELILDHAGKDITQLMKDELEHLHSEGAYEMLDELFIGHLEGSSASEINTTTTTTTNSTVTQRSSAITTDTDASGNEKDHTIFATDIAADVKKEKFLDLSKPLLYQLWKANYPKDFYMKQVHIPRHLPYSARVFESDFFEVFSRTPWWLVPILWLPVVAVMFHWSIKDGEGAGALSIEKAGTVFLSGVFAWSLTEYSIHRFLFHVDDLLPDSTYSNVAHFLLHGTPLYLLSHALLDARTANAFMSGLYFGYICYDMVHYYLHHARVLEFHFKEMKTYHLAHHYKNYDNGYGITSKMWDRVFGTLLEM
ncbi:fatty acid alpha-hydroxylase [Entomortierella lignicola]|nr:fatty acid alpha-hydroxylase [Entomortierella lignicola]